MELTQQLVDSFGPDLRQVLREKFYNQLAESIFAYVQCERWKKTKLSIEEYRAREEKSWIKDLQKIIFSYKLQLDPWYIARASSKSFSYEDLKAQCEILKIKNNIAEAEGILKKFLWKYRKPSNNEIDVELIKENLDPELILGKVNSKTSKSLAFLCLWHNEKTASLHYYKKAKRFVCFGCGEKGDLIQAYMKLNNKTFIEACKELSTY